ncbi:MAG: WhiB family transcriptional regulator [Ilumatobacteraceae bacterium]
MINPGKWSVSAACRRATDRMAIPLPKGRGSARGVAQHVEAAREICQGCRVLDECRAWALSSPDPAVGMVAGGLTPAERSVVRTAVSVAQDRQAG